MNTRVSVLLFSLWAVASAQTDNWFLNWCRYSGTSVVCEHGLSLLRGSAEVNIRFRAVCDIDPAVGLDFRRLDECTCVSTVINKETNHQKSCPCRVCPAGLGSIPVTTDCSEVTVDSEGNLTSSVILNGCAAHSCTGACFNPTEMPSHEPTMLPSDEPSVTPSVAPSGLPSSAPTLEPSMVPSDQPSDVPSTLPSLEPTFKPSGEPSRSPTVVPSMPLSIAPSVTPPAFMSRSSAVFSPCAIFAVIVLVLMQNF